MSAPERWGRAGGAGRSQRPSATPGALPADAASVGAASSSAGGGAAQLTAAAPTPGAAGLAASMPRAATPGAADAPRAGMAALSLHTPGPGFGAAVGGDASATRPAPLPPRLGPSGTSGTGASDISDGAVAGGGGVPGQEPAAAAASPTPAGVSVPDDGPPVPVGDDGAPLSAEAVASPFSPPASEWHAAFLKLVDHGIKAGLQSRHKRCADFCALAAEAGVPLFGGDSIIVASQRANQAAGLHNQACVEPDLSEKEALQRRAWAVLLAHALPVLQSRMDKGSLLPGKLRKVEEAYDVYETLSVERVIDRPAPGAATLQGLSRLMGYDTALRAAVTALALLPRHSWHSSDERGRAQAFVLATLRLIPKSAALVDTAAYELKLVELIERHMTADNYGADFCASVLAVWRSRAVVDVLRSHGSLQGAATVAAAEAEYKARQAADLAKRGLRRCALPSCGKQEATVLQFRVCGHCQTTRYCCPEHAKQHWKVHKQEYEAEAEEGGGEPGEAGAG